MAQSDRFYFWRGYWDALKMLPTAEQRDALVMGICSYAFDGEEPGFDDPVLVVVWQIVRDQVAESVNIGREMAKRGRRGGKASGKARSSASSTGSSSASSEGKGTDRKGSEQDSPNGESGDAAAADAAPRAHPDDGLTLPPMPEGWE